MNNKKIQDLFLELAKEFGSTRTTEVNKSLSKEEVLKAAKSVKTIKEFNKILGITSCAESYGIRIKYNIKGLTRFASRANATNTCGGITKAEALNAASKVKTIKEFNEMLGITSYVMSYKIRNKYKVKGLIKSKTTISSQERRDKEIKILAIAKRVKNTKEFTAELGVSRSTSLEIRRKLGINLPPATRTKSGPAVTHIDNNILKNSLKDIATKLGCEPCEVVSHLKKIPKDIKIIKPSVEELPQYRIYN